MFLHKSVFGWKVGFVVGPLDQPYDYNKRWMNQYKFVKYGN